MKIAFVNSSRGWGGAEEQMLAMTRELERRGHDITVVCRRGGPIEENFSRRGHSTMPVSRKKLMALVDPFRVATKARAERFSIIHSHRDHDLPLGKLLALSTGGSLLLTQHCMPNKPSPITYRFAARIISVSAYIAAGINSKIPAVSGRIGVIANGIDPGLFANPDPDFWSSSPSLVGRGPLLGAVGSFYKGQEDLIALLPALLKEFPNLALILIGEDEGRKQPVQDLARRLGVDDAVVFAGRIPRESMKDALAGLDFNVSLFTNEGFGLSVVEGMSVGVPFVGCRAGGYPEIVENWLTGVLVEKGAEIVPAIKKLYHDKELYKALSVNAKKTAINRFSLEKMVDAYEALYQHYSSIKGEA